MPRLQGGGLGSPAVTPSMVILPRFLHLFLCEAPFFRFFPYAPLTKQAVLLYPRRNKQICLVTGDAGKAKQLGAIPGRLAFFNSENRYFGANCIGMPVSQRKGNTNMRVFPCSRPADAFFSGPQ